MPADTLARVADRHARMRWVGVGLFGLAAGVFAIDVAAVATGRGSWHLVPLALFALGMSLGAFGTNDDTTLHALHALARDGQVPARHAAEWAREQAARPRRLAAIHASPKASFVLPLVALAVLGVAAARGLAAWGLLP